MSCLASHGIDNLHFLVISEAATRFIHSKERLLRPVNRWSLWLPAFVRSLDSGRVCLPPTSMTTEPRFITAMRPPPLDAVAPIIVNFLLDNPAAIKSALGYLYLLAAVERGDADKTGILLDLGIDPNLRPGARDSIEINGSKISILSHATDKFAWAVEEGALHERARLLRCARHASRVHIRPGLLNWKTAVPTWRDLSNSMSEEANSVECRLTNPLT